MTTQEQKVLTAITELSQNLYNEGWHETVQKRLELFNDSLQYVDIQVKYNGVKSILSMYGGMGSINDQPFNNRTEKLKNELYLVAFDLLKIYWKNLGNEFHDDNEFSLFPIGAKVKLTPNTIRYFDNDEKPVYTPDKHLLDQTIWRIISNSSRDITNMPAYGINSNGTYSSARHNCLTLLE